MPIHEWHDLMRQTVQLEPALGRDAYGAEVYGATRTVRARVEGRLRMVLTQTGQERVSTVTVYLGELTGTTPRDRLTLPAAYTPSQPPILAVGLMPDEAGVPVEVLYA
jgi:hypothetical protein